VRWKGVLLVSWLLDEVPTVALAYYEFVTQQDAAETQASLTYDEGKEYTCSQEANSPRCVEEIHDKHLVVLARTQ
jgi:hypothetical protein